MVEVLDCQQNFYTERSRSTVLRRKIQQWLSAPSNFVAAPKFSPLCFESENIASLVFFSKTPGQRN